MTKAELDQLQKAVNILDSESNSSAYDEDGIAIFENATSLVLAAIRYASLEIGEAQTRSWWKNLKLSLRWKYALLFK